MIPADSDAAPGRSLRRLAHAKINLSLAVGPVDAATGPAGAGGMHPISSWMSAIELADEVELAALALGEPSRHRVVWAPDAPRRSPIDWPIDKDLAVRAHRLLEAKVGRTLPVDMVVRKRTPVGGGLGGGSSDGAAALCGLNELFGLGLSTDQLAAISKALGSDVAFFIDDRAPARPAVVGGFGDRIERVAPVPARVMLVVPPFGTPTGPVYRAYDASPVPLRDGDVRSIRERAAATGRIDPTVLFNDLAAPACAVEPRLARLLTTLRSAGVSAHVSGSGSTLFVIDPPPNAAGAIRAAAPDVALVETRLAG